MNSIECKDVVVNTSTFASLTCVAPSGCGLGTLTVTVNGSQTGGGASAAGLFAYDVVTLRSVRNSTTDATKTTVLTIVGTNFGVTGQAAPTVLVGQLHWFHYRIVRRN